MTQQWKPISSAPMDGTGILGYWNDGGLHDCNFRAVKFHRGSWWETNEDYKVRQPTHWMPLPAAPGTPKAITCTEERPCLPCYLDQGECAAPPASAQDDAKDDSGMSPYCPECNGGGRITVLSDNSPEAYDVDIDCTHCDGTGSAADAATNLAKALQRERVQHLQMYGEYKNFHRSLCARFGYDHDEVHFRRDLVSLEEAIAAKVAAPAAGDARKPDFARAEQVIQDYVAGYEMCGEDQDGRDASHTPTEGERALIIDAIHGLMAQPEFIAALSASQQQEG